MKNSLLAIALLFPSSAAAGEAPPPGRPEAGPQERKPRDPMLEERFLDKLDERLQLKAEQKAKIKGVLDRARPELEKLHTDQQALRARMKTLMSETREGIRASLDMEQKTRFDELMVNMRRRHKMPRGMRGPRMHGGPEGGPRGGPGIDGPGGPPPAPAPPEAPGDEPDDADQE